MLTENGIKFLCFPFLIDTENWNSKVSIKDFSGTTYNKYYGIGSSDKTKGKGFHLPTYANTSSNLNADCIIVGSGTTAPNLSDYTMPSMIQSGLNPTSVTWDISISGDVATATGLFGLTNTSDSPITVTEVGLINVFGRGSNMYSAYALLDHTLLQTPVTIPAGDSASIQYILNFEIPSGYTRGRGDIDLNEGSSITFSVEGRLI